MLTQILRVPHIVQGLWLRRLVVLDHRLRYIILRLPVQLRRHVLNLRLHLLRFAPHLNLVQLFRLDLGEGTVRCDERFHQLAAQLEQSVSFLLQLCLDLLEDVVLELHEAVRDHVVVVLLVLSLDSFAHAPHLIILVVVPLVLALFIHVWLGFYVVEPVGCLALVLFERQKALHCQLELRLVALRLLLELLVLDQLPHGFLSLFDVLRNLCLR